MRGTAQMPNTILDNSRPVAASPVDAYRARDSDALMRLVADRRASDEARRDAMYYLISLGDERAIPIFVDVLRSDSALLRVRAARGLKGTRAPDALQALTAALTDQERLVRVWALDSLAASRHAPAVGAIRVRLEDPDHEVRGFAAKALGELHDLDAVRQLEALLADESRFAATRAAGALASLRTTEARDALVRGRRVARSRLTKMYIGRALRGLERGSAGAV
jgi:HEAT repeat protein